MEVYIARQPILNDNGQIVAYELLYRGKSQTMDISDGNAATLNVINNTFINIGFDDVIDKGRAFINFTGDLIKRGVPTMFNNEKIVIEILEDVKPEKEVIEKILQLKELGFTIALDDFVLDYEYDEIIKLADIVKIDFLLTDKLERLRIAYRLKKFDVKLLAEKVETNEEYIEAKKIGCKYFQGFFFEKPQIIKGVNIKSLNVNHISALNELKKEEPNYKKLTKIVKRDFSMTFKFLKLVNSVAFYSRKRVESLDVALVRIGFNEINKYIFVLMLEDLTIGTPQAVAETALIRARFAEQISKNSKFREDNDKFFLAGLFSLIDVIMHKNKEEALKEIPISMDVKNALSEKEDNAYSKMIELLESYERGNFDKIDELINYFNINLQKANEEYFKAIEWEKQINGGKKW